MTTPTRDEIRTRIGTILGSDFRIDVAKVKEEATFRGTFGMDSLDIVDFVFFLQKEFGIRAELDDYRELHTVRKLVDFVEARLKAKETAG